MTPATDQKLKATIEALEQAKETASALADTPYGNLAIRCDQSIGQLLNMIRHSAGLSITGNSAMDFPPLTQVMGSRIESNDAFNQDELKPIPSEIEIFRDKVNRLHDEFGQMDNDTILKTYVAEPSIIRGVAKKVGREDYAEAELTYEFMDAIRAGIADKGALQQTEQNIELDKLKAELELANQEHAVNTSKLTVAHDERAAAKNKNEQKAADKRITELEEAALQSATKVAELNTQIAAINPE